MKCPICKKGKMKVVRGVIKEDKIEYEMFRCFSCKEEILDMRQLKSLADKYRKRKKSKEITFSKWGNSIAVRIPTDIASEYKIKSGKHGLLTKEKEGIKIIPA